MVLIGMLAGFSVAMLAAAACYATAALLAGTIDRVRDRPEGAAA